jgi:lipopolysaccharide export system permease protein
VQPGRFVSIVRDLAIHIRERRPNGLLVGLLLDDRRDRTERVTILAEQGEILKNDQGSYLILENGSIQRHEHKQRDPSIVMFERYAFDLSQFTFGPQVIHYSARERNLWDLMWPNPADPQFKAQPGQFRAEFHDRVLAPVYPLAFLMIAFVYLGTPRTTRQSRGWSMVGIASSVLTVRFVGYSSMVVGINQPYALTWQYLALAGVFGWGIYAISRGIVIEPPAFLLNAVNAGFDLFARRAGAVAGRTS